MTQKVRMMCFIPAGGLTSGQMNALESTISGLYQRHFGSNYRLMTVRVSVPQNQFYLAGQQSMHCTAQVPVMDGLPDHLRHAFMRESCEAWMKITGCSRNQIIFSSPDLSYAKENMKQLAGRVRRPQRVITAARLLLRLLNSKLRHGHLSVSVNISN